MKYGLFSLVLAAVPIAVSLMGSPSTSAESKWIASAEEAQAPDQLGEPIVGLTDADENLFIRGRRLFRWELWRPDRGATAFNGTECSACHREPYFGGSNIDPETYAPFMADDTHVSGMKAFPRLQRSSGATFRRVTIPAEAELRRAPSLFGLGLLEAVPEATILAQTDPSDKNKDGISGRVIKSGNNIGRFGWKGHVASIRDFTIDAFKTELGMNISSFEREDFAGGLGASQLNAVVHFLQTLGPPKPRKMNAQATQGSKLFSKVGCADCHTPSMTTGESKYKPIAHKTIRAYSDMLLHEMGSGESHKADGPVARTEYRTAPLWGIGEFTGPFWHDGSAKTLEEAILKHGGESEASKLQYQKLSAADKGAIQAFLKSL